MEQLILPLAQWGPLALLFGLFLLVAYRLADRALAALKEIEALRTQAAIARAEADKAMAEAGADGVYARRRMDEVGILLRRIIEMVEKNNG